MIEKVQSDVRAALLNKISSKGVCAPTQMKHTAAAVSAAGHVDIRSGQAVGFFGH